MSHQNQAKVAGCAPLVMQPATFGQNSAILDATQNATVLLKARALAALSRNHSATDTQLESSNERNFVGSKYSQKLRTKISSPERWSLFVSMCIQHSVKSHEVDAEFTYRDTKE